MRKGFAQDGAGGALGVHPVSGAVLAAPNSGAGDDTYLVDSPDDVVVENPNEGTDTVFAYISYDLTDNVENLSLSGNGVLSGHGNALNNVLISNSQVNYLYGGLGDDTYYIQNAGDMVEEAHHEGTDTIYSTVSYSLFGRAVENFIMQGNGDLTVWGNSLNNLLVGNSGHNLFQGEAGADTMVGGDGNDTYIVTSASDVVIELEGEGYDLVQSTAAKYTLSAHIQNLTLMGAAFGHQEGTGNAEDNILMDAHNGTSLLRGGVGNDTYYLNGDGDYVEERAGEGYDVIYSTGSVSIAGQYVERVELTGTANSSFNGNSIRNILIGNSGNNIISGWGGGDYLEGGLGNDVYYIWDVRDDVVERAGEGYDTIYSEVTYDLAGRHVEVLNLGRGNIDGTGNSLANILRGGDGNNVLTGLGGADRLDGFGGADTLIGGTGNDTYIVDGADDVVIEAANQGYDTVLSSVTFALSDTLEALTLTGTANIDAAGGDRWNVILGNDGNNVIDGGWGNDDLTGGGGSDTFVFSLHCNTDIVRDFSAAQNDWLDVSAFSGGVAFGNGVTVTQTGDNRFWIVLDAHAGNDGDYVSVNTTATYAELLAHIIW